MAERGNLVAVKLLAIGVAVGALGACADIPLRSDSRPQAVDAGSSGGGSAVDAGTMQAFANLEQLEAELKELRSTVEVQQFELEKLSTRQRELYDDLDRRVREQERAGGGQAPTMSGGSVPTVGGGSQSVTGTSQQGASQGAGATTPSGQGRVIGEDSTGQSDAGTSQSTGQVDNVTVGEPSVTVEQGQGGQTTTASAAGPAIMMDEQDAYDNAFGLLKQSRYSDAVVAFEEFIRQYPASDLTDDAYYWMSEAHYVNREFEASLAGFQTVVNRFPDSQRVPASYLKIGYIQYEIGAYDQARQTLNDVVRNFPTHRVAVSAESRLQKMDREGVGVQ
jgi:tol-pal system protein YbgF